ELTVSSNLTIWSLRPSVVLMVALVGPALVTVLFPPQPVASTNATVTTVKSKYRFIGGLQVFLIGGVLAGYRCTSSARLLGAVVAMESKLLPGAAELAGLTGVAGRYRQPNACGRWP